MLVGITLKGCFMPLKSAIRKTGRIVLNMLGDDTAAPAATAPGFSESMLAGFWASPLPVQSDVSPAEMQALVERIRDQWSKLGEEDPYWSVLTSESFRRTNLNDDRLRDFYETGRKSASLIDMAEQYSGIPIPRGACLELGCGVGRITRQLATKFDKVYAVDISPGNLGICKSYLQSEGVDNVEPILISEIADFDNLPEFDCFYSLIAIQHNSPPIQKRILDCVLPRIRKGGAAVFQIVTDMPGYEFQVHNYLTYPELVMEVHALPQAVLFDLLRKHGFELRSLRADNFLGSYGSYTVHATRDR